MKVNVGLSNRHLHVSNEDLNILFGQNYELTHKKDLSQPGQYAADEIVDIEGPKGTLKKVRILGPVRPETQVEISFSDARTLGVAPFLRDSGKIDNTPGCKLIGPKGTVEMAQGVIVASRHIHMHTDDAANFDLKDKDIVNVETAGERGVIFKNVLVRVSPNYALEMHIDIEEGNSAGLSNGDLAEVIKITK